MMSLLNPNTQSSVCSNARKGVGCYRHGGGSDAGKNAAGRTQQPHQRASGLATMDCR